MDGDLFLTDGGIETTLIFSEGIELPHFAAFHLLKSPNGEAVLQQYFQTYVDLANRLDLGLILETATWRANADWGARLDYNVESLASANSQAVRLIEGVRATQRENPKPIVISGCIGPRGDGYVPGDAMTEAESEEYHRIQVETFANSAADMVTAITMNYCEEAVGIVRAARHANMPVVISFTVETDGRLPTGQPLGDAIKSVDDATSGYTSYFMINCAHPSHFDHVIADRESWVNRIRGLRANASRMSHAELDEAEELDIGNPEELGRQYAQLKRSSLNQLNVMGGCCGTDHRHVEQIAKSCLPDFRQTTKANG